jgi:hypothetical protein
MRARPAPGEGWTSSRLGAAIFFALAAWGSAYTALSLHQPPPGLALRPIFAAAAMAGMLAGWFHVHRSLGKGFVRAALAGINAGITALLYFAVLAAAYNTLRAYRYTKFDTATALLEHVVLRIVDVCLVALEPQVCATILIGSAVAGTYAEQMRRAWD